MKRTKWQPRDIILIPTPPKEPCIEVLKPSPIIFRLNEKRKGRYYSANIFLWSAPCQTFHSWKTMKFKTAKEARTQIANHIRYHRKVDSHHLHTYRKATPSESAACYNYPYIII